MTDQDQPKCFERKEVVIPDCKESNADDCRRAFRLYLPSIVCTETVEKAALGPGNDVEFIDANGEGAHALEAAGTLPLVFAIHCLGCAAEAMTTFVAPAQSHNMVLVLPEGLHNSFNARHCCGYALEKNIDDVGFLKYIQSSLSEEFSYIQSDISYAVGWSNGGFMVMHAASLFRSISPISGHVYDIDSALKKGGTFCVDGICVDAPGEGKGMFLHHGKDDSFVRPTGCCNDPESPKCCCNIAADECVPIMDVAQNWASEVNQCELSQRALAEDEAPSIEEGNDVTPVDGGLKEASAPAPKFSVSYADHERGIECSTAIGTDCKTNTTICLYDNAGHFNRPSFENAFPFAEEVVAFFARDACGIEGGTWNESMGECNCPEKQAGAFCLDDPIVIEKAQEKTITITQVKEDDDFLNESPGDISSIKSHKSVAIGYLLVAIVIFTFIRHRCKRRKEKVDRFNDIEEATELVSSARRNSGL
ncbi:hypothetical protein ACHAWF_018788 [Thalassiosira exigua]